MSDPETAARVVAAAHSPEDCLTISPLDFNTSAENEILFFYKPECFLGSQLDKFTRLQEMVLQKFEDYAVKVDGIILLSGAFLAQAHIMDRHYGFINRLSRGASTLLTNEEKTRIEENLSISLSHYRIFGGHEFLQEFPMFNEEQLNQFWLSRESCKMRSGYYYQAFEYNGKNILIVNGFHPLQLSHFTRPGRRIILFLLHSNHPWMGLKNDLIGDTFPDKAIPSSIRGEIYNHRERYDAVDISITTNYVHLSAGPYEALYELWNFFGNAKVGFALNATNLSHKMVAAGMSNEAQRAILNPAVQIGEKTIDLFSITENMDSRPAVEVYHQNFSDD
jgi:hypothetical protein